VIVLVLVSETCLAADYFGAIAYSTRSGANGWSKDHPSREAAEKAAVAACAKHAKDCRAVLWFKNGCGALAVSAKAYGWGWGTTQALADGEAIKACAKRAKGCQVKHQVCTANSGTEP
jgi:Domain of unknown function (DUF4189)